MRHFPMVVFQKALKQLSLNTSSGTDFFLNDCFIYGRDQLVDTLLPLLIKNSEVCYFLDEWSTSFVIQLHKKEMLMLLYGHYVT